MEKRTGYRMVAIEPDHHLACMGIKFRNSRVLYIREHRLVMAEHLGRALERWEVVHHRNHDKLDNRIDNLELIQGQALHNGETIAHVEFQRLKAENAAMRQIVNACPICRAALMVMLVDKGA